MENNKDREVNKGYIDKPFYEGLAGSDLEQEGLEESFQRANYKASETINGICGSRIEDVGLSNLSQSQQNAVKRATFILVDHILRTGDMDLNMGAGSASVGLMSFSFASPTNPNERRYIPEDCVHILESAGLLYQTIAVDPMKQEQKKDDKRKYIYRRWGLQVIDDSLFISDGTTDDGGSVRMKISDKFQIEINKSRPISDVNNHIVYYNTFNWQDWNDNALIHKGAVMDAVKGRLSKNLTYLDKSLEADRDTFQVRFKQKPSNVSIDNSLDLVYREWLNKEIAKIDKELADRPTEGNIGKLKEEIKEKFNQVDGELERLDAVKETKDKHDKDFEEVKDDLLELKEQHNDEIGTIYKELKERKEAHDRDIQDLNSRMDKVDELFKYIEIDSDTPNHPIRYKDRSIKDE